MTLEEYTRVELFRLDNELNPSDLRLDHSKATTVRSAHIHTMGRNPQSAQIHTAGYTNQAETTQALSNKKTCLPCKEYPSQLRWWMYALVAWFDSIFRGSNWRSAPDSRSQAANGKPMVQFSCPFSIKLKRRAMSHECEIFFFLKQKLRRKRLSPDRVCLYTKSIFVGRLDDPLLFRMTCCDKLPQALAVHEANSCTWGCPRPSPSLGF